MGGCGAGAIGGTSRIVLAGNYAYVGDNTPAVYTFDISNPTNVILRGKYTPLRVVNSMQVDGDRLYVANGSLEVLNRANPTNLFRISAFGSSVWGCHVIGNRAYLAADYHGLEVYDITNPLSAVRLGGYDTPSLSVRVTVPGQTGLSERQPGWSPTSWT